MAKNIINFIMTGGTIDSYYEGKRDTILPNKTSIIPKFIESLNLYESFKFTEICMKDSRELTKRDLINLLKTVGKSPHKRIIITHGTYTMPDTARFLKFNLKKRDRVVILTGSMIPLVGFTPSDAPFNLGYAISKLQELPNGIYVCMNGRVFTPDEITKDLYAGRFSSVFGEK